MLTFATPTTATQTERLIAQMNPTLGRSKIQRLAPKALEIFSTRRSAHLTVTDFYHALRVLGLSPDPTALTAIKNMETAA